MTCDPIARFESSTFPKRKRTVWLRFPPRRFDKRNLQVDLHVIRSTKDSHALWLVFYAPWVLFGDSKRLQPIQNQRNRLITRQGEIASPRNLVVRSKRDDRCSIWAIITIFVPTNLLESSSNDYRNKSPKIAKDWWTLGETKSESWKIFKREPHLETSNDICTLQSVQRRLAEHSKGYVSSVEAICRSSTPIDVTSSDRIVVDGGRSWTLSCCLTNRLGRKTNNDRVITTRKLDRRVIGDSWHAGIRVRPGV